MSPDGGPWLVSVHDLEPAPEGAVYVLWFLGRDQPRRAGVLAPGPDRAAQMSAETMPGHEAMTGVAVTLETTPQTERPSGPMLLFGDQRISII
jgi:anti-sigma-K factor RskA